MNLPATQGYNMEPFIHEVSEISDSVENVLNDGYRYGISRYKNHVSSGETPFKTSGMNSDTLKNTITMCMDYRQRKRWSFAQLKCVTKGWDRKATPSGSKALGDMIVKVLVAMNKFGLGRSDEGSKKRRT